MTAMRNLNFDITAHDKTSRAFQSVKSNIGGIGKSLGALKGLIGAAFGAAAFGAIARFSNEARLAADEIGKVSKTIGITAETLQEFRFAADIAGVSNETLDKGFQKFTRTIGELRSETGALSTFLIKFDKVLASNLKSAKTTDEALAIFFKRLEETSGAADRAALAAAAFGRAGVQLVNIVENGAGSIAELRQELRDLGGVISNEVIKDAEDMNDEFTRAEKIISTQLTIALLDLQGPLLELKRLFADIVAGIGAFLNRFREIDNLSLTGLRQRLEQLKVLRDEAQFGTEAGLGSGNFDKEIAQINALIAAKIKAAETPTEAPGGLLGALGGGASLFPEGTEAGLKAAQKASDKLLIQAEKENKTRRDAIQLLRLHNVQQKQLFDARKRSTEAARTLKNQIDLENEALRLGITLNTKQGDAFEQAFRESKKLEGAMEDLAEAQQRAQQFAEDLGTAFSDAFGAAVAQADSLKDALRGLAGAALSIISRNLLQDAFSGAGGGSSSGSVAGGFFSSLFGFARGGSFTVGGSGGTDSQLVAFRATPGESVAISRPGSRAGGAVVQVFIDASHSNNLDAEGVRSMIAIERPGIIAEAVRESQRNTERQADIGGGFASAVGRR